VQLRVSLALRPLFRWFFSFPGRNNRFRILAAKTTKKGEKNALTDLWDFENVSILLKTPERQQKSLTIVLYDTHTTYVLVVTCAERVFL
jgi:hypothetical protein